MSKTGQVLLFCLGLIAVLTIQTTDSACVRMMANYRGSAGFLTYYSRSWPRCQVECHMDSRCEIASHDGQYCMMYSQFEKDKLTTGSASSDLLIDHNVYITSSKNCDNGGSDDGKVVSGGCAATGLALDQIIPDMPAEDATSAADCRAKCAEKGPCLASTFADNVCTLFDQYYRTEDLYVQPESDLFVKGCKTGALVQGVFQSENSMKMMDGSLIKCQEACRKSAKCLGVSHTEAGDMCYLLTDLDSGLITEDVDWQMWRKDCDILC